LKKYTTFFILIFYILSAADAQSDLKIKSSLLQFYKNYPQEKTYVQTDKDAYFSGESLWFSLYAITNHVPSELSKIAYVQLVSGDGKIITQKKLPLYNGISNGDLILSDSLRTGIYQLRCFTSWMLNFDENFIFHKEIYVVNLHQQAVPNNISIVHTNKYRVIFFPEGGDLIDSNLSNVAFKATDENGLPVEMTGEIKNEIDDLISNIHTVHDGMGEFSFRPLKTHKYYADLHFADGTKKSVAFPDIKSFGITLRVLEQTAKEIDIGVLHHDKFADQHQNLILALYQNSGKVAVFPLQLENGNNIFSIKKDQYSSGILRLTIFSQDGIPLAERVLFVDKGDKLGIALSRDSLSFAPLSKNQFTVKVNNADWKIDSAYISVAISDANKSVVDTMSDNICSAFLLSSELKGHVHHPGYYFSDNDDKTKEALDLVMLTNGWRHFKWEEILDEKQLPINYPVEKGQYLVGEIVNYNKALIEKNIKLKILIENSDSSKYVGYAEPDSNGKFVIKDYPATGNSTIFFQGISGKNKARNIRVHFFNNPQDSSSNAPFLPIPLSTGDSNSIVLNIDPDLIQYRQLQKIKTLKSVTIRGLIPTKADQVVLKYVSPMFAVESPTSIDLVNNFYPNSISLYDFMKGRFPGLIIAGNEDNVSFMYRGSVELLPPKTINSPTIDNSSSSTTSGASAHETPYFYLNEVLSSWQGVKNIPLSDIALIQFLPPPVPIAPFNGGFRGAISIYTKRADEMTSPSAIGNYNHYTFNGYNINREFYSPDYENQNIDRSIPDVRSTLYWNPYLELDNKGEAHIHFFNSSRTKKYRVVVTGMDAQGKLAYFSTILE
jgi:hypothetical protein